MNKKSLYIETFGCQMNDRDSEIMRQLLSTSYDTTAELKNADAIIVNTCSIRGKAEQKAYSLLGALRKRKKENPDLIIAATGCVAQQEGGKMLSRMPHVDLVVGPQHIYRLPELFTQAQRCRKGIVATDQEKSFHIPPFLPSLQPGQPHKRFVTIMQGCNNFCTYCIVPFTRGREISRKPEDILAEVRHLAAGGVKEITLLGQNVNSYGNDQSREERTNFSSLLHQVAQVDGIERIRFTTSNPKDLSEELMRCFADQAKLCHHFHLPVQSGSNAVLQKMNRKYTIENYLEKVEKLRGYCRDIALTTDIIVGFPGETRDDFQATLDLLRLVRYHGAFSFKYSSRPPAKSCDFEETVSEEEKIERLAELQKMQKRISLARNREYIGKRIQLMVEGESKSENGNQWAGRSSSNHTVNFLSPSPLFPGQFVDVVIREACLNSLRGELANEGGIRDNEPGFTGSCHMCKIQR
ncbi:MAG: tRNA (N6-isopentenyl adenosine(37)-C2)-methylthiotransferase MiaB [Desulfobulbaceae bacterium DB1]|nr:MAG: tRNA (N6-isopentenyl adenosine(37)-C2)-methylthiotransferase MiaB [Desulfobulbaceae bacterium DB1]